MGARDGPKTKTNRGNENTMGGATKTNGTTEKTNRKPNGRAIGARDKAKRNVRGATETVFGANTKTMAARGGPKTKTNGGTKETVAAKNDRSKYKTNGNVTMLIKTQKEKEDLNELNP
uniref:Uncharacterized protein n=1 Tax=Cacopsylla melanoneura TaxID=428564 RepID=A0A8D9DPT8_9HEMI